MKKFDEFKTLVNECMSNITDQSKVSMLLKEIQDAYLESSTEYEKTLIANEELTKNNTDLQKANMQFLLSYGASVSNNQQNQQIQQIQSQPDEEKAIALTDLVDDKGNLKF